jgi:hypothetical protein
MRRRSVKFPLPRLCATPSTPKKYTSPSDGVLIRAGDAFEAELRAAQVNELRILTPFAPSPHTLCNASTRAFVRLTCLPFLVDLNRRRYDNARAIASRPSRPGFATAVHQQRRCAPTNTMVLVLSLLCVGALRLTVGICSYPLR